MYIYNMNIKLKNPELLFFKVCKNNKQPIKNEKYGDPKNLKPLDNIDTKLYNVGISCRPNNLIILDVDSKDDGLNEWNEYIKKYSEPLTVCEKTPNGGYHYYFNHISKNYSCEQKELIDKLKNKSKYRNGKGLDIRKGNGYVVCDPSTIDNKKYEFIRHYKDCEILDMPLSLLEWILEYEKEEKIYSINDNLNIIENIDELKNLLKNFSNNDSKEWIKVTACIKNLLHPYNKINESELLSIWDDWSKGVKKYNEKNNNNIWNSLKMNINFNSLIIKFNDNHDNKIKLLESIKHYEPITKNISGIKKIEMNNKFIYDDEYNNIQLNQDIFDNNETIIIESTTGTGKTSNTAKFINNYIQNNDEKYKILSIVSRISLASQHIESFKNENIEMISYEQRNKDIEDDNMVCCINSLSLFSKYKPEFFKNYIVYIDEISTFTRHLTDNNTLNNKLKPIYITLMKIINNCKKIILTEAIINDNVFNIVNKRPNETKIFIKNTYVKYKGIQAIQHNDENIFLDLIISHVKNNQYFLFGCDSCDIITKYYTECLKTSTDCILITADAGFKLENINDQFKDKFVFYSPSITCGVDFSINSCQDVFLYIKGDTLNPSDSFQQLTRTRNIRNVYFYINEKIKINNAEFKNIEECKEHYKNKAYIHSSLSNLCFTIDENDELKFNNNTFFKLFSYNEYINDIYKTNKEKHFKQILLNNGFILSNQNDKKKLIKDTKNKLINTKEEYKEKVFNEHIENINNNEVLENIISFLNIKNEEDKKKYYEIINNKYIKDDYLNLIRLFTIDEIIKEKLNNVNKNNVEYKAIHSNYNKISLLRRLEKELGIETFQIEKLKEDKSIIINEQLIKEINKSFISVEIPKTYNDCIEYYVKKLKNLCGNIKIIDTDRVYNNYIKKKITRYTINEETLKFYFELHYLSNPTRSNIKPGLLKRFKDNIKQMSIDEFYKIGHNDNDEEDDEYEGDYYDVLRPIDIFRINLFKY